MEQKIVIKPVLETAPTSSTWQDHLGVSERQQQQHYDTIAADYEAHYTDERSVEYRRRIRYEPMFEGIDLAGKEVLDAMCGSAQTTSYLMARGAKVTGLDISNEVLDRFQTRWNEAKIIKRS